MTLNNLLGATIAFGVVFLFWLAAQGPQFGL